MAVAQTSMSACALHNAPAIELAEPFIRVRDVISLDCIDASDRPRAGDLVVARLPAAQRSITIEASELADLVARRLPMTAPIETGPTRTIRFATSSGSNHDRQASPRRCLAARTEIASGALIHLNDLAEGPCTDEAPARVRYEPSTGLLYAGETISPGAAIGPLATFSEPGVEQDQAIALDARVGAVRVRRLARALQSARAGEPFFARSEDGDVFVAPPISAEESR